MKTRIKRILFYLLLVITVIIVSSSISIFLYKDRLIQRFISEVNQQIKTPINVNKIDVSLFDNFPYLSIEFNEVTVQESYSWSTAPLLTAQKIGLSLNPLDIIRGNYSVKQVYVQNATIYLKIDRKGVNNFSIIETENKQSSTVFDLNKIILNNVEMRYQDLSSNKDMEFHTEQATASLSVNGNIYNINANGDLYSKFITFSGNSFLENKQFTTSASVIYNHDNKTVSISPSSLRIYETDFILEGGYNLNDSDIQISLSNDATDLKTILALIPERYTKEITKYNSAGNGYIDLKMNGNFEKNKYPSIQINFGLSEASIFHPDFSTQLEAISLNGVYQSDDFMDLSKTKLVLKNLSGQLNNRPFTSNLLLNNFDDLFIDLEIKGNLEISDLLEFYGKNELLDADGFIDADITLKGKINDLKHKSTVNKVLSSGTINLINVNFIHATSKIPFTKLNGNLGFNNSDLMLSNFSGNVGSSNFTLNGIFKNFPSYILLEDQPIGIEANFHSTLLDMDELLSGNFTEDNNNTDEYSFSISKNLQLKLNCNIEQIKFRRFLGNDLTGDLLVKDQVMASEKISVETMDGKLSITGSADASTDSVYVYSDAQLEDVAIDQIFFVFENFNQEFLMDTQLKGGINATVSSFLAFDKHLNFDAKEMVADISATIIGGELNNFAPMQSLAKYIDEQELSALRFSKLQNDIHIENNTIYIPKMEVNNNASNIVIGGTHTFEQEIDYTVVAPLNNRKKYDKDAAFGAIEEDANGKAKVYLKITGTTDNYKVSYDTKALKNEVISNFKQEVKELKDAFRTKGAKEKKEVVLEDDEYFDW